jgi:hypothetical protein
MRDDEQIANGEEPTGNNEIGSECPRSVRPRNGRNGTTKEHRRLVDALANRGALISGFRSEVERAVGARFDDAPRMIPDAFVIRHEPKVVSVFEIEVYHQLDAAKERKITAWAEWLHSHGWTLELRCFDQHGGSAELDPFTFELTEREIERCRALMERTPGFAGKGSPP